MIYYIFFSFLNVFFWNILLFNTNVGLVEKIVISSFSYLIFAFIYIFFKEPKNKIEKETIVEKEAIVEKETIIENGDIINIDTKK